VSVAAPRSADADDDRYRHNWLTRRVLESLVPVICPPEATELGLGADIVDHVELTMGALPGLFRAGLVAGIAGYDAAAALWPPAHGHLAHMLSPELARRWFESWLHGPTPMQRELVKGIKQVMTLAHYEHPVIQERLGYRPQQWIEKVKRRRLEVYADDIGKHHASITAPDPLPRRGGR